MGDIHVKTHTEWKPSKGYQSRTLCNRIGRDEGAEVFAVGGINSDGRKYELSPEESAQVTCPRCLKKLAALVSTAPDWRPAFPVAEDYSAI